MYSDQCHPWEVWRGRICITDVSQGLCTSYTVTTAWRQTWKSWECIHRGVFPLPLRQIFKHCNPESSTCLPAKTHVLCHHKLKWMLCLIISYNDEKYAWPLSELPTSLQMRGTLPSISSQVICVWLVWYCTGRTHRQGVMARSQLLQQ